MTAPEANVFSSAKINLFLEVVRRRPDGYHSLWTVFQEISLGDILSARRREDGRFSLSVDGNELPVDRSNLVLRAAEAYRARRPSLPGMDFHLNKKIPIGAGLGGGSGNAAAALRLCRALGPRVSASTMREMAGRLGADVPFFLKGGLARAGGVGDRLTSLSVPRRSAIHFVLVFPRVFSSTPEAFQRLRWPLTKRRSPLRLTQALQDGAPPQEWAPMIFNRLEEAVVERFPVVAEAKRALIQAGCLNAVMSGSGSSVFGVARDEAHARQTAERLRPCPWDVWRVSSVSGAPAVTLNRQEGGHHGNNRSAGDVAR